jgi:hypothetical protein
VPRDLHPDAAAEIVKPLVRPVLFFEGHFVEGVLPLWSGRGIYQWNGRDWTGAGGFLGISDITETVDLRSNDIRIELSGVDNPDIIRIARRNARKGYKALFWFGMLKEDRTIVLNPELVYEGKLDVPTITADGGECRISISYVSEMSELKKPRALYMTHEQQQVRKPGDVFFQYTALLVNQVVTW